MRKPAGAKKTTGNRTPIKSHDGAWKEPFLEHLERHGSITAAAKHAGVRRGTPYEARKNDPVFGRQVDLIVQGAIQQVEDTLYDRAVSGASDTALIFFLKTRKPEVYGDQIRAEQIEQIKADARKQVLAELQAEMRDLTPAARKAVMRAIPSATG
jgi:hypothetical protein